MSLATDWLVQNRLTNTKVKTNGRAYLNLTELDNQAADTAASVSIQPCALRKRKHRLMLTRELLQRVSSTEMSELHVEKTKLLAAWCSRTDLKNCCQIDDNLKVCCVEGQFDFFYYYENRYFGDLATLLLNNLNKEWAVYQSFFHQSIQFLIMVTH